MPTIGEGTAPGCLRHVGDGAAAAADAATGVAVQRRLRRQATGGRDADIARDAHAQAVALDLDFGEVGFVEQLREFADQLALVGWLSAFGRLLSGGCEAMGNPDFL